jgi:hypothetical protein
MNLLLVYPTRNYHLVALLILCGYQSGGLCRCHLLMSLIVVTDPDRLSIRDAEINAYNATSTSTL